ncbi:MAG: hypothetical protein K8T90_09160 [Planctomycetes bacterium]|nr:hypothetical protein [Planctomycetota bacterium]
MSTTTAGDWTFETRVHFKTAARGRKRMLEGAVPEPRPVVPGSVPRVARLVALAHRFAALVESGEVRDYADVARLAGVTRARVTQIMNLLHLAPDIQEAILDLPRTLHGPDPFFEFDIRKIAAQPLWSTQRQMWRALNR